ncbi:MAG TPA: PEPxxWA-CTERM sorting domain-containing protein [Sphingomicrobium sp.]
MNGVKIAAIAAGISLVAVGAAAPFTDLPVRAFGGVPDVLSMLHKRSPEQRPEGALASTKGRVSAVLPTAVSAAPAPKVASVATPAAKAAPVATYAVPETPMVLPAAVVPAVASALPLAAAPAAAGGLFIPPLVIPGGGGGGGGITTLVTPPTPPTAVPGVPEPATWAMMIIGFGLLGGQLRRRRRTTTAIGGVPAHASLAK